MSDILNKIKSFFTPKKKKKKKKQTVKATPVNHEAIKKKINTRNVVLNRSSNQSNNTSKKRIVTRKKQTSDLKNNNMKTTSKKIAPIKDNKISLEEKITKDKVDVLNKKIKENSKSAGKELAKKIENNKLLPTRKEVNKINSSKNKIIPKKEVSQINVNNRQRNLSNSIKNDANIKKIANQKKELEKQKAKAVYDYNVAKVKNESSDKYDSALERIATRGIGGVHGQLKNILGNDTMPTISEIRAQRAAEESNSKIEDFIGSSIQSIGQMVPAVISNLVAPGSGFLIGGLGYGKGAYNEAINEGKSNEQALKYGMAIGTLETTLGKVLGGIPQAFGKGAGANVTKNVLSKVIKNKSLRDIISNSSAEFTEEYLQEYLNPIVRNVTLDENNEAKLFSMQNLEAGLMGAFTSAVMNTPSTISNVRNERQMRSTFNENESRISNLKNNAIILQEQLKNTQNIVQAQPIQEQIENAINEIRGLREQNNQIRQVIDVDTPTLSNNDILKANNIDNSIYNNLNTQQKINDFRESVNKYLKNNKQTQNFANTVEKIINDKGYNIVLDNNIGDNVNGRITPLENGEVLISINPNSERAGEFVLMHEVTHAIETEQMKKLVMDYASKNFEFANAIEDLKQTYGTNDVSDEVLADISGQLFGNQEFINNLSTQNPSVFKRIYDVIISLANKITGNSNEALFIRDLKNKWESAYRTQNNNLNISTKYNLISNENNTTLNENQKKEINDIVNDLLNEADNNRISLDDDGEVEHFNEQVDFQVNDMLGYNIYDNDNILQEVENIKDSFIKDDYYVAKEGHSVDEYSTKANNVLDEATEELQKQGFEVEESRSWNAGAVNSRYYTKNDITVRVGDHFNGKESRSHTEEELYNSTSKDIIDYVNRKYNEQMRRNDTRYSQISNSKWQEHIEKNYKSEGTKTNLKENLKENAPKSTKVAPIKLNNTKYMYVGKKGVKNATKVDKDAGFLNKLHKKAVSLEKQGNDYETIRQKTGWFKGKDGKWRFEINDNEAKLQNLEKNKTYKLKDILQHEEIYILYPKLKNVKVKIKNIPKQFDKMSGKTYEIGGYYTPALNSITINNKILNKKYTKKVLLHEIQHIIQKEEKFNQGYVGKDIKGWNNNLGEQESYDTESRVEMDTLERLANKPYIIIDNPTQTKYTTNNGGILDAFKSRKSIEKNMVQDNNKRSGTDERPANNKRGNSKHIKTKGEELENSSFSMEKNVEDKTAELLDRRPKKSKKTVKDEYNKIVHSMVNKGNYIDNLAKKSGNQELKYMYDKTLNATAEGQYAIGVAQTDNNGNKIGKSVLEIWKPIEDAGKEREFSLYLLHKHNIDRFKQGKPVFGENVTDENSKQEVKKYETENPEFKHWAQDIYTYNKNQLQNMVDAGLTSVEAQEYLNDTYSNYVRINRDIKGNSTLIGTKDGLKVNAPIKKAKGGNQDILPLKESMAQQTIQVKKAIRQNLLGLELKKTLGNGENIENFDSNNYLKNENDTNFRDYLEKNSDGKYYFTIFDKGTPTKMEIDEGLYNSLKSEQRKQFEDTIVFKGIQKASSIHRSLLTVDNPLFVLTNFFKDIGDAPLNSKYPVKFYPNYVRAIKEWKTNGKYKQMYQALGGMQNTYFDYEKGLQGHKNLKFLDKINGMNEAIEQLPRLAEFISTIESGGSKMEAMYNAAEITTNFKRGGNLAKTLNRNGAIFLNASIQGASKQIRNFSGQNGVRGYINILSKVAILGIMPSLLNDLLLDDDEEYKDLPDYVKDTYYLFKTKDGTFIRIPKGRVLSVFGALGRRTKEYIDGEEDAFKGFGELLANQIAPNNPLENNVFTPIASVKTNISWNGSPIVSSALENELPKNQYDEKTDEISKWLGEKFNLSPKKINYILDQYSGGIGDVILPFFTSYAESKAPKLIAPLVSKFTVDSTVTNKNLGDFYDLSDEYTKKSNSIEATEREKLISKYLTEKSKEISELSKKKKEIQASKLKDKEKYDKAAKIQAEINSIAKETLQQYKQVKEYSNYAKVSNKEYYINSKGEWQKVREEIADDLNMLGMNESEKNIYYKSYLKLNSYKEEYEKSIEKLSENDTEEKYKFMNIKREKICNEIKKLKLPDEQKAYIYSKAMSKTNLLDVAILSKIDMNEFLTFSSKYYTSDKNANGNTIRNSKKKKVINAINKLNLSIPQKAILIKQQYNNYEQYDNEIINYIEKLKLTEEEKKELYEELGFKVETDGTLISYSGAKKKRSRSSKKSSKKKKSASVTRTKVAPVKLNSKVVNSAESVSTNKSQYNDVLENLINYQNLSDEEKRKMLVKVGNKK